MAFDLPAGARRLLQRADGYVATLVSGQVVMRDRQIPGIAIRQLARNLQEAGERMWAAMPGVDRRGRDADQEELFD